MVTGGGAADTIPSHETNLLLSYEVKDTRPRELKTWIKASELAW